MRGILARMQPRPILVVNLSLCVDEVFVLDVLKPGSVYAGMDPVVYAGGKGPNVARALVSLGVPVRLFGAAGGEAGRRLACALAADGIPADLVPSAAESRQCVILVERLRRRETVLNGTAPRVKRRDLETLLARINAALERGARGLILTGSLPRDCPGAFYARILASAARAGIRALVDSSGEGLLAALSGRARHTTLKVNRRELRWLLARSEGRTARAGPEPQGFRSLDETLRAADRARVRFGLDEVVITGGSAEVVAIGERRWVARPPRVKSVNAVGSGDALAAGLKAATGEPLAARLALGIAAGANNCEDLSPCRLDAARVRALARRVRVREAGRWGPKRTRLSTAARLGSRERARGA